jgi:hypothetical protein
VASTPRTCSSKVTTEQPLESVVRRVRLPAEGRGWRAEPTRSSAQVRASPAIRIGLEPCDAILGCVGPRSNVGGGLHQAMPAAVIVEDRHERAWISEASRVPGFPQRREPSVHRACGHGRVGHPRRHGPGRQFSPARLALEVPLLCQRRQCLGNVLRYTPEHIRA